MGFAWQAGRHGLRAAGEEEVFNHIPGTHVRNASSPFSAMAPEGPCVPLSLRAWPAQTPGMRLRYCEVDAAMVKSLLGKKIGMTQVFDEAGAVVPATLLQVGPCMVTQVKAPPKDRAAAVQIGFQETSRKKVTKPRAGHFAAAGVAPQRVLRDVAPDGPEMPEVGQEIGVSIFEGVPSVDVVGVSKGRGTAGVVKRHGFAGQPATHGGRTRRLAGSIGAGSWPGRVWKGTRMAGHMGAARVTVRNLQVLRVDPERNFMLVRGCVPGSNGGYVLVRKAVGLERRAARAAQE